ncbi:hypothetical protein M404DRAFT_605692 [Pisolithus tinctorius Marx 270]|uniref:Uncharacterized protein n=1 Tax=Pisolithus tinctorius Marx 270 TaxID=870435 RepID=A0A0C3P7W5_PISTI|nr:hypothetical protein M404DRAFT_605692 [Pisolithus tinctorius Marx 270]
MEEGQGTHTLSLLEGSKVRNMYAYCEESSRPVETIMSDSHSLNCGRAVVLRCNDVIWRWKTPHRKGVWLSKLAFLVYRY